MIKVSSLTKHYAKRTVVDHLTFDVRTGCVTGFVGPNGAGKSTTMRMMVGLTRPDSGSSSYDGIAYADLKSPAHIVGSVLDARCMHPGRTARNHLRVVAANGGIAVKRVEECLAEVGLEDAADQRAGGFSLGMRQRLALATALLGDPYVLLLDEPSNGLDPDGIRWLRNYLGDFAAKGGTVFLSSHLIGELALFAEDLIVVRNGKLLAAESVETLTARGSVTVVVQTPQLAELMTRLTADGLVFETVADRLHVHDTTATAISLLAFDHGIRLIEITEVVASLEDSLLDLTSAPAELASA